MFLVLMKTRRLRLPVLLLTLIIGAALLSDKSEGLECYKCGVDDDDCFYPDKADLYKECYGIVKYCIKSFAHLARGMKRQCEDKFYDNTLINCANRLLPGVECIDPYDEKMSECVTDEQLKLNNERGGRGDGNAAKDRVQIKFCYCEGDRCNKGPIPGLEDDTDIDPGSAVNCYQCTDVLTWASEHAETCKNPVKGKTGAGWCPSGHCYTMTGVQKDPQDNSKRSVVQRSCDTPIGFNLMSYKKKAFECAEKNGKNGCDTLKSIVECVYLATGKTKEEAQNDLKGLPFQPDYNVCICKGDLCNGGKVKDAGSKGTTLSFNLRVIFVASSIIVMTCALSLGNLLPVY